MFEIHIEYDDDLEDCIVHIDDWHFIVAHTITFEEDGVGFGLE